jgi:cupin 2 domain-containing protein
MLFISVRAGGMSDNPFEPAPGCGLPGPDARRPSESILMRIDNLFANAAAPAQGERFEALLSHKNLVIERIVSSAEITPTQYVQTQDEWVAMLQGEATLEVAGEAVELRSGDYLFLPAGTPHTVRRVSEGALWLAIHLH